MLPNKRILEIAGLLTEAQYKFHIDVPPSIMLIFNVFNKNGKKLYVVGGAVRDAFLGKKPKDFDLTTDAVPSDVQKILTSAGIHNFPKGESFGVIAAVIDKEVFEIATFRSEDYTGGDGRRPNVDSIVFTNMKTDAARRDLTINALYYDIESETIIDLVGGIEDLKNKKIRTVGDPMVRFKEDRLRTLRALRFAHRFGSALDQSTINAIIHFKDLPGVSAERIRDEFISSLKSSLHPDKFIQEFIALGLMPRTFPGLEIDSRPTSPDIRNHVVVLAKLFQNNSKEKVVQALYAAKYGSEEIEAVAFLLELNNRFKDFDKLVFDPSIDGGWFINLVKKRDLVLSRSQLDASDIYSWAKVIGIKNNIINSFLTFKPQFSAASFPGFTGKELGAKIVNSNAEYFLKNF